MKQSRRGLDQFQDELQGKLNQISQRRSNKKIKNKSSLISQHRCLNQLEYSGSMHRNNGQSNHYEDDKQNNASPSSTSNKQPHKIHHIISQQNSQEKPKEIQNSEFSTISNKQLYTFLSNLPQCKSAIDLSYFLAKSLAMYSSEPDISQQHIKQVFLLLQGEITTTDPNTVSINALQLAIKKKGGSFKMYMLDKIMEGKLVVEGKRMKEREKGMQRMLCQSEESLRNKERELIEKEKIFMERQKVIAKKQKQNSNKQKQLIERIKNSKKILQERAQKLNEEHLSQLQVMYDKIQKKIQNYERNMKLKVQNIGQKLNEIHRLKQIKQIEIKNNLIKQIEDKYQKIYCNKYKKYQNDINQFIKKQQNYKKFIKQLEDDNKGLMKICNKLQIKINKQENKLKDTLTDLQNKCVEIKQLKFVLDKKNKQNQQIINKLCKNTKSNNKKQDHSHDALSEGTKPIKQSTISASKSKKSLSSKKKRSTHNQITPSIQIDEIVDIYEVALQLSARQLKKEEQNDVKFFKYMLELSTKLYLYHQKQCKQLIQLIYHKTITNINNNLIEQHQSNNNRSLSFFSQIQTCYPKQSAEAIYKHYITIQNNNNKSKQEIMLWKYLVIFCLFSPNWQSSYYWLKALTEAWENGQIQNQMKQSISSSQKELNFMFAIVVKLFLPHHSIDLNVLDIISGLLLNMKLVGQQAYSYFWHGNNIGILLIKDYTVIVRNILQDQIELKQEQMEQVERISILVQRLVVGYNIAIKTEYCEYFDKLRRKWRGTLLEKNLNSVLENYDTKTEEILKQLDDV